MREEIALTLSEKFKNLLINWGMSQTWSEYIVDFSVLIIVLILAIIIYYISKYIINRVLRRLVARSKGKWDDYLFESKVFTRLALLIPAMILKVFVDSIIASYPVMIKYIHLGINLYIIFIILYVITSFLNAIQRIYSDFKISDSRPIKGYIQITKIIIYVIGGIIVISVLAGQSPLSLLAGLGAMSAIVMLVFKDTILGFVAGIQLSASKSLKIGDWITIKKYNTDGSVFDVSLVTIKVRNWDNSVSNVPTYAFVSNDFQNWSTMTEAGGRRMKKSFSVDVRTIHFADQPLIDRLKEKDLPVDTWMPENKQMTNLGLFRRYLVHYLQELPVINSDATLMTRQLQPSENGIPVEIYAFFRPPGWEEFENFQSDFFEHIFAILPEFGLAAFQRFGNEIEASGVRVGTF